MDITIACISPVKEENGPGLTDHWNRLGCQMSMKKDDEVYRILLSWLYSVQQEIWGAVSVSMNYGVEGR